MEFRKIEVSASDRKPSGKWAPDTITLTELYHMLLLHKNVELWEEDYSTLTLRCDVANRDAVEYVVYRLIRR